jgi:hypothetical protein
MFDDYMRKLKAQSMSDDDIHKILPGIPLTLYSDLDDCTYGNLVDNRGRGMVLFVQSETADTIAGHWLGLCRLPSGSVLVFDPYGGKQDPWYLNSTWISGRAQKRFDEESPQLARVIQKSGLNVTFNPTRYQKDAANINTCGRHCIVRLLHDHLSNDAYGEWMRAQDSDPDTVVTEITEELLKSAAQ